MSITGMDLLKRRIGSIKQAMADGELFEQVGREWIEEDFKPYAKSIAPVDTGEYRDSIDGAANPQQIRVYADAPHSSEVEYGTIHRPAQPTIGPAVARTRRRLSARMRKAIRSRM